MKRRFNLICHWTLLWRDGEADDIKVEYGIGLQRSKYSGPYWQRIISPMTMIHELRTADFLLDIGICIVSFDSYEGWDGSGRLCPTSKD